MPAFIETQFPIARLSAESYKERKAVSGQTLTCLGKWWGRKPLILVRASIVGMLMPASTNAKKDREIFLKILTMDDEGTWNRCNPALKRKITRSEFDALPYSERIADCERPEKSTGPIATAWTEINSHLGTNARSLKTLIDELGQKMFGHTPRVGDSFCGGGSIPFEAARIGCKAFGSDLNPVAGLLTWASLNLLGGAKKTQDQARKLQEAIFIAADKQITNWKIEHNESGERAEAYLYCVEVKPESCDYYIPLAPSWVISEKFRVVVDWIKEAGSKKLKPEVRIASENEFKLYKEKKGATVVDGRVIDPFNPNCSWSIEALRGSTGLRQWLNEDVVPKPDDVFQERLYCIRWVNEKGERRFAGPESGDVDREAKVLNLVREYFAAWQKEGFIPSKVIPDGYNTEQPVRERGWTHWHHLFTPRQLLVNGLISKMGNSIAKTQIEQVINLLVVGRSANWNSRLCRWLQTQGGGIGGGKDTFSNQALNTLYNFSVRPIKPLLSGAKVMWTCVDEGYISKTENKDARDLSEECDLWITDPPYADAVNYHELGDFFLAWYDKQLSKAFHEWIPDARAELAVRGDGEDFRRSMVEIYKNLAKHMPNNGMQMVMFTHQDPAVWADLGMILWAAGLKATAAWTISTETEAAGIKKGNYVQGTVCLILRKRTTNEPGFLDEVYPLVEDEVKRQIASMQALDEGGEPNFNDADYQLAAYAAALKVLTQYGNLDGKDVAHEVFAVRDSGQKSDFEIVIERALSIACSVLIPKGFELVWRELSQVERYYLRALDIESKGERRQGMYEELARGFGIEDIKPLLKSDKANGARMNTPSGLGAALLGSVSGAVRSSELSSRRGRQSISHPFASTSLRHLMFAIRETAAADNNPEPGRQYLRDTFGQDYWGKREGFIILLERLVELCNTEDFSDWSQDGGAARILAGRLRNDQA